MLTHGNDREKSEKVLAYSDYSLITTYETNRYEVKQNDYVLVIIQFI